VVTLEWEGGKVLVAKSGIGFVYLRPSAERRKRELADDLYIEEFSIETLLYE